MFAGTETVRRGKPSDDAAIIDLLIASFTSLYSTIGESMSAERRRDLSDQAGRRASAISFVRELDGLVVGTLALTPPSTHSQAWVEGAWYLGLLAVDSHAQGRGIAGSLIRHAERHARAAGATAMCLHARRGIHRQARLYVACGYGRDPVGDLTVQPYQEGYLKVLSDPDEKPTA